ncbi:MAG: UxaA family hydrolase [Dehalococcoidia bacterium]|nr:UxaA family hydrolase [Dehalococcoidia bacterium]
MNNNALKVDEKDNIAVATGPIAMGSAVIVNGEAVCNAFEDIRAGHKVALVAISSGGKVVRYGEVIVQTTQNIKQGQWVHVHNTRPVL